MPNCSVFISYSNLPFAGLSCGNAVAAVVVAAVVVVVVVVIFVVVQFIVGGCFSILGDHFCCRAVANKQAAPGDYWQRRPCCLTQSVAVLKAEK